MEPSKERAILAEFNATVVAPATRDFPPQLELLSIDKYVEGSTTLSLNSMLQDVHKEERQRT